MMFGIQLNDHYGNPTLFQLSMTKSLRTVNHTFYIISSMEKTKCWFASHLKFITGDLPLYDANLFFCTFFFSARPHLLSYRFLPRGQSIDRIITPPKKKPNPNHQQKTTNNQKNSMGVDSIEVVLDITNLTVK